MCDDDIYELSDAVAVRKVLHLTCNMFNMDGVNGDHRCPPLESSGVVPVSLGGSPTSANSSDLFLYDDSSMSDGSLYASDQENLSIPRKRYVTKNYFDHNSFLYYPIICSNKISFLF